MSNRIMAVFAVVLLSASLAHADDISTYADNVGLGCWLTNIPVATPFSVFVIHKFNAGAGASQFRIQDTTTFIPLSQTTIAGLALGQYNTDWSIAYGASCIVGDLVIATLNFLYFGGPPLTCANNLTTFDAPTSPIPGEIALVNCSGEFEAASGGAMHFGPMGPVCNFLCGINPVTESTWGSVKALYR